MELRERENEDIHYRIIKEASKPENVLIQKTGMVSEFTIGDILRDQQLLQKKKEELEAQIAIEEARMQNIDRSNPKIGKMSEEMRQVVFIYERAFAFSKVGRQKVEEIKNQLKEYREETLRIALETGLGVRADNENNAEETGNQAS